MSDIVYVSNYFLKLVKKLVKNLYIYIGIFVFPFAFLDTTFCSKIKETILKVISCKCDLFQKSEFMRDTGVTIKLLSLKSVGDEKKRRGGVEERGRGGEEVRR